MKLHKTIPMTFENHDYEIRVLYSDVLVTAVPFYQNRPQNYFRHQIMLPKKVEASRILDSEAMDTLVGMAKNDVLEKRGEALIQFCSE